MHSEDCQVYCVCILQFSCFTKNNNQCSQNINKQKVNLADDALTDYSFLSRYHYTKSKNYSKRRYQIRHWIPMFIGTPCTVKSVNDVTNPYTRLYNFIYGFYYLGDDIFRTLECNLTKRPWYIYSSLQFAAWIMDHGTTSCSMVCTVLTIQQYSICSSSIFIQTSESTSSESACLLSSLPTSISGLGPSPLDLF